MTQIYQFMMHLVSFFIALFFPVLLIAQVTPQTPCRLAEPIQLIKPDLISQRTVIRGYFENSPDEQLEFVLIAPKFGPMFDGKYIDHLSFNFVTKPSALTDERFMRMTMSFESKLFIKFETDIDDYTQFGLPGTTYNTIYIQRSNPQPSPLHWSSSVMATVDNNKLVGLVFWTPKDWSIKQRVSFCLTKGELVEQIDRPL